MIGAFGGRNNLSRQVYALYVESALVEFAITYDKSLNEKQT